MGISSDRFHLFHNARKFGLRRGNNYLTDSEGSPHALATRHTRLPPRIHRVLGADAELDRDQADHVAAWTHRPRHGLRRRHATKVAYERGRRDEREDSGPSILDFDFDFDLGLD